MAAAFGASHSKFENFCPEHLFFACYTASKKMLCNFECFIEMVLLSFACFFKRVIVNLKITTIGFY